MRNLNLSQSFFTDEGEFLDEFHFDDVETEFGKSQEMVDEIKSLKKIKEDKIEVEITAEQLDEFWQKCRNQPLNSHELLLWEGDYETESQYMEFSGRMRLYLNCWTDEQTKPPEPLDEGPQPVQLDFLEM